MCCFLNAGWNSQSMKYQTLHHQVAEHSDLKVVSFHATIDENCAIILGFCQILLLYWNMWTYCIVWSLITAHSGSFYVQGRISTSQGKQYSTITDYMRQNGTVRQMNDLLLVNFMCDIQGYTKVQVRERDCNHFFKCPYLKKGITA